MGSGTVIMHDLVNTIHAAISLKQSEDIPLQIRSEQPLTVTGLTTESVTIIFYFLLETDFALPYNLGHILDIPECCYLTG